MLKKDLAKITFRVTEEKKETFNIMCIKNKTSMQEVLSAFIDNYIENENVRPAKKKRVKKKR